MHIPDTGLGMSYRFVSRTFVILFCTAIVGICFHGAQGQTRKTPQRVSKEVPVDAGKQELKTSATLGARPAGDTRPFHYPVQTQAEYTAETDRLIQMYVDAYNVREKKKDPEAKPIEFKEAKKILVRRANRAWTAATKNESEDPLGEFARAAKDTQGQIPYNKAYANPLDVIYQWRTQCDGSTDYQLLLYRLKPKKDVPNNANPLLPPLVDKQKSARPVAILESGHVLFGAIESGPDGDHLIGYESTAYGKARKDYGPLSGLSTIKNPPIPVPMEFYLRAKLEPMKARKLYVESGIDLLKNYSLDVAALRSRYANSAQDSAQVGGDNQSKIDQIHTPWDLPGGPDVPDGDLARMELEILGDEQIGNQISSIRVTRPWGDPDQEDTERKAPNLTDVNKTWAGLRMTQFVDDEGEFAYPPDWVASALNDSKQKQSINSQGHTPAHYIAGLLGSDWDGGRRSSDIGYLTFIPDLMRQGEALTPDSDGNLPIRHALLNAWEGVQTRLRLQESMQDCMSRKFNKDRTEPVLRALMSGKNHRNGDGLTAFEALAQRLPDECNEAQGFWLWDIISSTVKYENLETIFLRTDHYRRMRSCFKAGGRLSQFIQMFVSTDGSRLMELDPENHTAHSYNPKSFPSKVAGVKELMKGHEGLIPEELDQLDADGNTVLERLILNKNLNAEDLGRLMNRYVSSLKPLAHTPPLRDRNVISMVCERGTNEGDPEKFATLAANMIGLFQIGSSELSNREQGAVGACGKLAAKAKSPNLIRVLLRDVGTGGELREDIARQLVRHREQQDSDYVEVLKAAGVSGRDVGRLMRGQNYCPADPVSEYLLTTHPESASSRSLDIWLIFIASCRPDQYDDGVKAFQRFMVSHPEVSFDPSKSNILKKENAVNELGINFWDEEACEKYQAAAKRISPEAGQKLQCKDLEISYPNDPNGEDCKEYSEKLISFHNQKPNGSARPKYSKSMLGLVAEHLIQRCSFDDVEVLSKLNGISSEGDLRDPNCTDCAVRPRESISHSVVSSRKNNVGRIFCPTPAAVSILTPQLVTISCEDLDDHLNFAFNQCAPKYLEALRLPIYQAMIKRCSSKIGWERMQENRCVDEFDLNLIKELKSSSGQPSE